MPRTTGSQRVTRYLERQIRTVKPGSALPSFRSLMKECQVGPSTVTHVLKAFEQRNLVVVRPQRGIFRSEAGDAAAPPRARQIDLLYESATGKPAPIVIHEELVRHLCEQGTARGCHIRMFTFSREAEGLDRLRDIVNGADCEACVIMNLVDITRLDLLHRAHVPYVNLFPGGPSLPRNSIVTDPDQVIQCQLGHLLELGHRRIGYLHNIRESFHRDLVLRREAFYRMALEHGLPIRNDWVRYAGYTAADRRAGIEAILSAPQRPSAVICADDHLSTVYTVARERGLMIGRDLSVMGTNDDPAAAAAHPPATTVRVPRLRSALIALDMLDQAMQTPDATVESRTVDVRLVQRESTAPVNES